jgi:soluble lytic murein transglycosylase-like protein
MDIRPDGSVTTYVGPVLVSPEGVHPLAFITPAIPPAPSESIRSAIKNAAIHHAISQDLIAAVAWQESHLRQTAVSHRGARGIMQLMPSTAQALRVNPNDLSANIEGGGAYLAQMLDHFDGDIIKSLAAYNAGPDAVSRYGGVPPYPETKAYVNAVLERLADAGANWRAPR